MKGDVTVMDFNCVTLGAAVVACFERGVVAGAVLCGPTALVPAALAIGWLGAVAASNAEGLPKHSAARIEHASAFLLEANIIVSPQRGCPRS